MIVKCAFPHSWPFCCDAPFSSTAATLCCQAMLPIIPFKPGCQALVSSTAVKPCCSRITGQEVPLSTGANPVEDATTSSHRAPLHHAPFRTASCRCKLPPHLILCMRARISKRVLLVFARILYYLSRSSIGCSGFQVVQLCLMRPDFGCGALPGLNTFTFLQFWMAGWMAQFPVSDFLPKPYFYLSLIRFFISHFHFIFIASLCALWKRQLACNRPFAPQEYPDILFVKNINIIRHYNI